MSRLNSLKRKLCEADFDIEIQYAVLGLLLIFQAVIPVMQSVVENKVPVPRPSLTARVVWEGNSGINLRIGHEVLLATDCPGRLLRLDQQFPHPQVAKNFTFRLEEGSSRKLCCWLSKLPDAGVTCTLAKSPIHILIFKTSVASQIEKAIDAGNVDSGLLPPGVIKEEILPGIAKIISLPEEILTSVQQ